MFGKKKRKAECRVVARDASGAVLMDVAEGEFALPEDVTIRLSVEFFNDPQPCEIHRAAVRWRALQQLKDGCPANADMALESLEESLRRLFPKGTRTVRIAEETP